jgi:hypothetical protein
MHSRPDWTASHIQVFSRCSNSVVSPPIFVSAYRLVEANRLIRTEADAKPGGKWANRAGLISEGLNPLLDGIENERAQFESAGDLGERLGGGGFGEVYKWRHRVLEIDFAVKVLNPVFSG